MIAPDKFAGTLSAVEAAEAIADGWRSVDPAAECILVPLSDGGPGFVEVLHTALGGTLVDAEVTGPLGGPVQARFLLVDRTAYVESALACGLHLLSPEDHNPAATSTYGVGELISKAIDRGANTVIVGMGGSATNDGGAGMLAALGAAPASQLRGGGGALAGLDHVDLAAAAPESTGFGSLPLPTSTTRCSASTGPAPSSAHKKARIPPKSSAWTLHSPTSRTSPTRRQPCASHLEQEQQAD